MKAIRVVSLLCVMVVYAAAVKELNKFSLFDGIIREPTGEKSVHQSTGQSIKDAFRKFFRQPTDPILNLAKSGTAKNCENPVVQNFTLTWNPEVVNPSHAVKFNLDMIAAMSFDTGTIKGSVYVAGSTFPFVTEQFDIQCLFIKMKFPQVSCPVKTGDKISIEYTVPNLTALPPGRYELKADIIRKDGKEFLCALIIVTIQG